MEPAESAGRLGIAVDTVERYTANLYLDRFSWTMVETVFHADAFLRLHRAG